MREEIDVARHVTCDAPSSASLALAHSVLPQAVSNDTFGLATAALRAARMDASSWATGT